MRSPHVDEGTLDALLSHTMSPAEMGKLKLHLGSCRPCARRVEEWRDLFGEVESIIPTVERPALSIGEDGTVTPIMVPSPVPAAGRFDFTRLLLPAGALIVAGILFLVLRSRGSAPSELSAGLDQPPPSGVGTAVSETAAALPGRGDSLPQPAPAVGAPVPAATGEKAVAPSPSPARATLKPALPAPAVVPPRPGQPFTETPVSAGFQRVDLNEAIRRLGGTIRLIDGMTPDHLEAGPGTSVPGARPEADVVRVVYAAAEHLFLFLDEQRIAPGSPGTGDTLLATGPDGTSLARWTDAGGFWLSLAGRVAADTLRSLTRRVR